MSKEKSGATIYYHDIGDYLSREQKLDIIRKARSINGVKWTELHPDEHGDWINHRNGKFAEFIPLGYNSSQAKPKTNIQKTIGFYNQQRQLLAQGKIKEVRLGTTDINWTTNVLAGAHKNINYDISCGQYVESLYRLFFK